MVTRDERRFYEEWGREPAPPAVITLKCGVALALLVLVAWVGVQTPDRDGVEREPFAATESARHTRGGFAIQRSTEVFEERRARFKGQPQPVEIVFPGTPD